MVRQHLGVILGTAQRLDPFRSALMLLRACSTRDLRVRDVADEQMAEDVLALLAHGRTPLPAHELLPLEAMQEQLGLTPVTAADPLERAEPEDLADDRCVLKQQLLIERLERRAGRR